MSKLDKQINIAKHTLKMGNASKAAKMFTYILSNKNSGVRDSSRHAEVWYYFSLSLKKMGKLKLAKRAFKRAKQLKNSIQANHSKVDSSQVKQNSEKDKQSKKKDTESQSKLSGNEPKNVNQNTYTLKTLKDEKAKEHYRKGVAYLDEGLKREAAAEFLLALETEGNNIELLSKTGRLLIELGGSSYINAQRTLKKLYSLNKNKMSEDEILSLAEADIYSQKPDLDESIKILQKSIKNAPKSVISHVLLGEALNKKKNYKNAIKQFKSAIKLDKKNLRALIGEGNSYSGLKQFSKAISKFSAARGFWPNSATPILELGKTYFVMKKYGKALEMLNLAYAKEPDNFNVNLALTELLLRSNDSRAGKHLDKCLSVDPETPKVKYWKAVSDELDQKLLKAQKIYTWLSLYDDDIALKSELRLGQLYTGKGDESFPGNLVVEVWPSDAEKYHRMFNRRRAYEYFSDVIEKNDKIKEAKYIKRWLEQNEDQVKLAIEFNRGIQNLFKQR